MWHIMLNLFSNLIPKLFNSSCCFGGASVSSISVVGEVWVVWVFDDVNVVDSVWNVPCSEVSNVGDVSSWDVAVVVWDIVVDSVTLFKQDS